MLAVSTLGVLPLGVAAFALLVVIGQAVNSFGRVAVRMTEQGNRVDADRPEFRRPPDEGGLL